MTRSLILLLLAGCFQSIAPDGGPDAAASGKYTTTRGSDGTYTTIIDATSASEWTHGDFETGAEVETAGPWDLRFQRFHISTNGGVSGGGGVEVTPVPGLAFADVTSPPASGWTSDAPDGDDPDAEPDYAFEQGDGWYDYNPMTHVVTPKPLVWVMKTDGGATMKLQIIRYYDDAGTAGWFTLHWGTM